MRNSPADSKVMQESGEREGTGAPESKAVIPLQPMKNHWRQISLLLPMGDPTLKQINRPQKKLYPVGQTYGGAEQNCSEQEKQREPVTHNSPFPISSVQLRMGR